MLWILFDVSVSSQRTGFGVALASILLSFNSSFPLLLVPFFPHCLFSSGSYLSACRGRDFIRIRYTCVETISIEFFRKTLRKLATSKGHSHCGSFNIILYIFPLENFVELKTCDLKQHFSIWGILLICCLAKNRMRGSIPLFTREKIWLFKNVDPVPVYKVVRTQMSPKSKVQTTKGRRRKVQGKSQKEIQNWGQTRSPRTKLGRRGHTRTRDRQTTEE